MARFADTYYLLALVNTKDQAHASAIQLSQGSVTKLVTTTWVLVEFADALCGITSRLKAALFIRGLRNAEFVEIVPPNLDHFERALSLYEKRHDKDWSLTDCLSFVLMEERGISEALTADHHFEQAGFRALMREK